MVPTASGVSIRRGGGDWERPPVRADPGSRERSGETASPGCGWLRFAHSRRVPCLTENRDYRPVRLRERWVMSRGAVSPDSVGTTDPHTGAGPVQLWPRHRIRARSAPSKSRVPETRPETGPDSGPVECVELVFTSDELGGLESRLRDAVAASSTGGLRTPATIADAVRQVTLDAGGDVRVQVHRRPAVLQATESWEIVLRGVPDAARGRLSDVLGRPI
jgi:hypothetical protein